MIKIYVNYIDITDHIDIKSISMNDSMAIKSDSCSFTVDIDNFSIAPPKASQVVEVRYYWDSYPTEYLATTGNYPLLAILDVHYDSDLGTWYTYEFKGIIQTVTRRWIGPPVWIEYECTCTDFTRYMDRNLVNETYPAGSYAGDIIEDIRQRYMPSDFSSFAGKGHQVPEMVFDFAEPSTCIQELAETIGYQWYVDFNKIIHFFWTYDAPSPFVIASTGMSNTFNIDTELVYAYNLELTEDASQVKNKIYVKNANFQGSSTNEDFVQSQGKFFSLFYKGYPGFDSSSSQEERNNAIQIIIYDITYNEEGGMILTPSDREITTILLDEVEGKSGDGAGDNYTVYVNFGSGIRLPDNYPLGPDQLIRIYYNKVESVPVIEMDQNSIDNMRAREGGVSTGIYAYAHDASAIYTENGEELSASVDRILLRYKDPIWSGTFQTRLRGWKAGQNFTLYSVKWGQDAGTPINEVVWVRDVTKTILKDDIIEYTISFSSSPFGD